MKTVEAMQAEYIDVTRRIIGLLDALMIVKGKEARDAIQDEIETLDAKQDALLDAMRRAA